MMNKTVLTIFLTLFLLTKFSYAQVCSRSPIVKQALTEATGKTCDKITDADLLLLTRLDVTDCYITLDGLDSWGYVKADCQHFPPDVPTASLESGDFVGLENLKILAVTDQSMVYLPDGVFSPLRSLEYLNLQKNKLAFRPQDFLGLVNLKELNLSDNLNVSPPADLFVNLPQLKKLYWQDDKTQGMPQEIFAPLKNLVTLNARAYDLERQQLDFLPQLEHLYIDVQGSFDVDHKLWVLKSLKVLQFSPQDYRQLPDIKFIPDSLVNLPELQMFAVWGGHFEKLNSYLFKGLKNLKAVAFDNTEVDEIEPNFLADTDLKNLTLYVRPTTAPPNDLFTYSPNLETIAVESSLVTKDSLKLVSTVTELQINIDNKKLPLPAGALKTLNHLKTMWIHCDNYLRGPFDFAITRNFFEGQQNLNRLEIVWTGISGFKPGAFSGLSNLTDLRISINQALKSFPDGLFEDAPKIKQLAVNGNMELNLFPIGFLANNSVLEELDLRNTALSAKDKKKIKLAAPAQTKVIF